MINTLRVEITQRCPLACLHCSVSAGPGRRAMVDTSALLRLIAEFRQQGGRELVITGGEPLEHHALLEILSDAKARDLVVTVFSTGLTSGACPLTVGQAELLATCVDVLRVSIHGSTDATHDWLTKGRSSLTATLTAVDRLVAAEVDVRATFLAHAGNLDELGGVLALCEKHGINELRLLIAVPQGRAKASLAVLAGDVMALGRAVAQVRMPPKVKVRLGSAVLGGLGESAECTALTQEIVVRWDGWISPCHSVEPVPSDSPMDNVFEVGLARALAESPRLRRYRDLAEAELDPSCNSGCLVRRLRQAA